MDDKGYSLVFEGRVIPGFARRDVIGRVAERMGRSPENLKRLFQDKPVTVKQGLTREAAQKQQEIYSKLGVACHVWPREEQAEATGATPQEPARKTGLCPKCGNDLTKFGTDIDECPYCGIIISKFLRTQSR